MTISDNVESYKNDIILLKFSSKTEKAVIVSNDVKIDSLLKIGLADNLSSS